jgi:hypothetical protein
MRNSIVHTGKKTKNPYDPQIGAAAQANAALAEKAQTFSQDYFEKYIGPALEQMKTESNSNIKRQDALYADSKSDADLSRQRYQKFGIPAEDKYFKMAQDFSAPEEEERQAGLALGDVTTAQGVRQQTLQRQLQASGVDPSSPAAISAMSDNTMMGAAAAAGAQTRARSAAKSLGMQLTSDAANFGRGGQSSVLAFGQAAGGNANAAQGAAGAQLNSAPAGAGVVQNGIGLGLKGYGANLDAYSGLGKASMESQGAAASGLGNFLGTIGAAAMPIGGLSDRRIKRNIMLVGQTESGHNIYDFEYLWSPPGKVERGVMAQDVLLLQPEAVSIDAAGFYRVDYNLLR